MDGAKGRGENLVNGVDPSTQNQAPADHCSAGDRSSTRADPARAGSSRGRRSRGRQTAAPSSSEQLDADMALAQAMQEQECAFMLLHQQQRQPNTAAAALAEQAPDPPQSAFAADSALVAHAPGCTHGVPGSSRVADSEEPSAGAADSGLIPGHHGSSSGAPPAYHTPPAALAYKTNLPRMLFRTPESQGGPMGALGEDSRYATGGNTLQESDESDNEDGDVVELPTPDGLARLEQPGYTHGIPTESLGEMGHIGGHMEGMPAGFAARAASAGSLAGSLPNAGGHGALLQDALGVPGEGGVAGAAGTHNVPDVVPADKCAAEEVDCAEELARRPQNAPGTPGVHGSEGQGGVQGSPMVESDEELARRLQEEEEREMAARLLAMAGVGPNMRHVASLRQVIRQSRPARGEEAEQGGGGSGEEAGEEEEDEEEDYEGSDEEGEEGEDYEEEEYEEGLDIDGMTYEELTALTEAIGTESKGLSPRSVASLPRTVFLTDSPSRKAPVSSREQEGGEEEEASSELCAICRCVFEHKDKLLLLPPCKHAYHEECITEWLSLNKVCPICKAEVQRQKK